MVNAAKPRLILVLGDQLSPDLSALQHGLCGQDIVVMAEVMGEARSVPHHPKKIALIFAAMRHFAQDLRAAGWTVAYSRLDDPQNSQSIIGELLRYAAQFGAGSVLVTQMGEWRLFEALQAAPLQVEFLPDTRFLCSPAEFAQWAKGRKELRMEYFYREMRRKTGLLMAGDAPLGGKWNFDVENRKAASKGMRFEGPLRHDPDAVTQEVLDLVGARFGDHFGDLAPFWFATTRAGARASLAHFLRHGLARFGDYQDAMVTGEAYLSHSVLSVYLNIGLLGWRECCEGAQAAYLAGAAPLNAVEGFIRQIIGWREFIRGIYFLEGPDYLTRNALGHRAPLPEFYWTGQTDMACLAQAIGHTRKNAYAHHIERLMLTGNFALLAGVDPVFVQEWYLAVYADAFEWVEAPNVIGMSQFADGGLVASKPYISGGNYIRKMSDHCKGCRYDVSARSGADACPFTPLYWNFIERHRDRFARNPRMAQIYRLWDQTDGQTRAAILARAGAILEGLASGGGQRRI